MSRPLLRRFWPRSLFAQIVLLLGAALLAAQLANFALLLNDRERLSQAQIEGPAIARFVAVALDAASTPADLRAGLYRDRSRPGARFTGEAPAAAEPDARAAARIRSAAADAGLALRDVRVSVGAPDRRPNRPRRPGRRSRLDRQQLRIVATLPDGGRIAARIETPRRDPWLPWRLALATVGLYVLVLGAALWIATRIARPLRALTRAAEGFDARHPAAPVSPQGPSDVARAIEAFNAMNARVRSLLDEKDRMLGALGHDLRTPLASLRIRAELIEDPEERARAAATIDEMVAMIDDILVLARTGRSREPARATDVAALVATLVDEQQDLGRAVSFAADARVVAAVEGRLLRRAVRNLIDNAVAYGGGAEVTVGEEAGGVAIRVADRGPGMAPDDLARAGEPFFRAEASRNRATGGSGLGLAIARAVAESHGGRLTLANRGAGGLEAMLWVPR